APAAREGEPLVLGAFVEIAVGGAVPERIVRKGATGAHRVGAGVGHTTELAGLGLDGAIRASSPILSGAGPGAAQAGGTHGSCGVDRRVRGRLRVGLGSAAAALASTSVLRRKVASSPNHENGEHEPFHSGDAQAKRGPDPSHSNDPAPYHPVAH